MYLLPEFLDLLLKLQVEFFLLLSIRFLPRECLFSEQLELVVGIIDVHL